MATIHLRTASGSQFSNYRSGYANLQPGDSFSTSWNQNFPVPASLVGNNVFALGALDVTPAPCNQPPYPASGEADASAWTVTGIAP